MRQGDARALAELYERHAARVHGFCCGMLGSAEEAGDVTHDAFIGLLVRVRRGERAAIRNPRAYLLAAARHGCLRLLERRRRVAAVGTVPDRPAEGLGAEGERVALTRDLQAAVRAANARLPTRQREVLALHEIGELPYDEVARVMETTPNAAAQLGWRARANLRAELRHGAVAAIAPRTRDCERALLLIELRDDAPLGGADDRWLDEHLDACDRCRASRAVLGEVATTYRELLPVPPAAGLFALIAEDAWAAPPPAAPGPSASGLSRFARHPGAAAGAATVGALTLIALSPATVQEDREGIVSRAAVTQSAAQSPPPPARAAQAARDARRAPPGAVAAAPSIVAATGAAAAPPAGVRTGTPAAPPGDRAAGAGLSPSGAADGPQAAAPVAATPEQAIAQAVTSLGAAVTEAREPAAAASALEITTTTTTTTTTIIVPAEPVRPDPLVATGAEASAPPCHAPERRRGPLADCERPPSSHGGEEPG